MNNMRRGFTMIELIFVIVIIGILAAVAIPKLAGTATKAREGVHEGFIGTLNRSVGPAMWADKVNSTPPGSVKTIAYESYTDLPTGVKNFDLAGCGKPVVAEAAIEEVLEDCADAVAGDGCVVGTVLTEGKAEVLARDGYEKIADIINLEKKASIYCLDGTGVKSPSFGFSVAGSSTIVYEGAL